MLLYIFPIIASLKKQIAITIVEVKLRKLVWCTSAWAVLLQTLTEGEPAYVLQAQNMAKGSAASCSVENFTESLFSYLEIGEKQLSLCIWQL